MKKNNGFTMIELMVVVTIIGILATVAISAYMKFSSKTRRTEVIYNLSSIYRASVAYYAEKGTYSNSFALIRWSPEGQCLYTYYMGNEYYGKDTTGATKPAGIIAAGAGVSSFTAAAWGNIDNDPTMDIWHVNDANIIVNDLDDLNS